MMGLEWNATKVLLPMHFWAEVMTEKTNVWKKKNSAVFANTSRTLRDELVAHGFPSKFSEESSSDEVYIPVFPLNSEMEFNQRKEDGLFPKTYMGPVVVVCFVDLKSLSTKYCMKRVNTKSIFDYLKKKKIEDSGLSDDIQVQLTATGKGIIDCFEISKLIKLLLSKDVSERTELQICAKEADFKLTMSPEETKELKEMCQSLTYVTEREKFHDLSDFLGEEIQVKTAVELNVRLMTWQSAPGLEVQKVIEASALIIGCGTLGCHIARNLLGWGVAKFTLVDSGNVNLSNLVRQSLYSTADVGRPKAEAAADAVKSIRPDVDAKALQLEVPMPGHCTHSEVSNYSKAIDHLVNEMDDNDLIFLVTDSRESRYVPSLLFKLLDGWRKTEAKEKPKICITSAVGFDSFVVIRETNLKDSACYFCNDTTAPTDSSTGRPIDMQCTVTRPGVSSVAAAMAVESAVAEFVSGREAGIGNYESVVRGDLANGRLIQYHGDKNENCICCSPTLRKHFMGLGSSIKSNVIEMLLEPELMERKSGISEAKEKMDNLAMDLYKEDDDF